MDLLSIEKIQEEARRKALREVIQMIQEQTTLVEKGLPNAHGGIFAKRYALAVLSGLVALLYKKLED